MQSKCLVEDETLFPKVSLPSSGLAAVLSITSSRDPEARQAWHVSQERSTKRNLFFFLRNTGSRNRRLFKITTKQKGKQTPQIYTLQAMPLSRKKQVFVETHNPAKAPLPTSLTVGAHLSRPSRSSSSAMSSYAGRNPSPLPCSFLRWGLG